MINIKAKFIGRSSLGYVSGKRYSLWFRYYRDSYWIHVAQIDERGEACEYGSYNAFKRNWEIDFSLFDNNNKDLEKSEFYELLADSRNQKINQLIQ